MSHLPESIRETFFQILWDRYMEKVTKNCTEYFNEIQIATVDRYFYERFTPPDKIMEDTLAEITNPYKTVIILKGEITNDKS